MPTPANTHGGARPGAGRKPKVASPTQTPNHTAPQTPARFELPPSVYKDALKRCADRLSQTLTTLEALADGTTQSVQERWAAAGTLTIGKGEHERPAYPHLPPEQLVLVSRTTQTPKPDTKAALYLADRVLGRPLTSDDAYAEEQIEAELNLFIDRIKARFTPELAQTIFDTIAQPQNPIIPMSIPLEANPNTATSESPTETRPEEHPMEKSAETTQEAQVADTSTQHHSLSERSVSPCLRGEPLIRVSPSPPPALSLSGAYLRLRS